MIVVSHDRESAEAYGDRIIELADGKIIGDKVLCSENITGKDNSASNLNLIKSKLPLKNCIKMGVSSLKLKRLRLAFSIFLSFIAFTVFGLGVTCATFNQYKTEFETVKTNGEKTIMAKSQMGYYEIINSYKQSFDNIYTHSRHTASFIYGVAFVRCCCHCNSHTII